MEMLRHQPAYTAELCLLGQEPQLPRPLPRLQTPQGGDTASPSGLIQAPDPSTQSAVCSWLFTLLGVGWAVWQQLELVTSVSGQPGPAL